MSFPRSGRALTTPRLSLEPLTTSLHALLAGESPDLITMLTESLPNGPELHLFQRSLLAADLETLERSFTNTAPGEIANCGVATQGLPGTAVIPQETLDDLLALKIPGREIRPVV